MNLLLSSSLVDRLRSLFTSRYPSTNLRENKIVCIYVFKLLIYFDFFERSFVFSDVSESLSECDRLRVPLVDKFSLGDDVSSRIITSDDALVLLLFV